MRSGGGYFAGYGFGSGGSGSGGAVASTPVSPAAVSTDTPVSDESANLTVVPAGATIKVDAQNLGGQPGRVSIVVGNLAFPGVVSNWSDNAVNITLPPVEVTAPVRATIVVRRPDGSVANETPFQLTASAN
jgi:hypothetical protein